MHNTIIIDRLEKTKYCAEITALSEMAYWLHAAVQSCWEITIIPNKVRLPRLESDPTAGQRHPNMLYQNNLDKRWYLQAFLRGKVQDPQAYNSRKNHRERDSECEVH